MRISFTVTNVGMDDGIVSIILMYPDMENMSSKLNSSTKVIRDSGGMPFGLVMEQISKSFQDHMRGDDLKSVVIVTMTDYEDMGKPTVGDTVVLSFDVMTMGEVM